MSSLAHKFKGSGFDTPEEKREYKEPDKRLQEAFERWLNHKQDIRNKAQLYDVANKYLEGIEATIEDAHALLLKYQDHSIAGLRTHFDSPSIKDAGFFASAIYNKQPEKRIVFDIDLSLWDLGYCLEQGKTLIALRNTGQGLGRGARGTIINYGDTKWEAGSGSEGLCVSYGSSQGEFGRHCYGVSVNMSERYALQMIPGTAGYLLDFAKTEKDTDWGELAENALRYEDPKSPYQDIKPFEIRNFTIEHMLTHKEKKIPELWEYLMRLKQTLEQGRDPKKAFEMVDSFGPEPAKTIKATIDDIFKRHGYEI